MARADATPQRAAASCCSSAAKLQRQVKKLIRGRGRALLNLRDECIDLCNE